MMYVSRARGGRRRLSPNFAHLLRRHTYKKPINKLVQKQHLQNKWNIFVCDAAADGQNLVKVSADPSLHKIRTSFSSEATPTKKWNIFVCDAAADGQNLVKVSADPSLHKIRTSY